jgi:membrane-bound metal-dependent hydrolase YbcI (DUF457 family)
MLLMCHLMVGILIGLVAFRSLKDRRFVVMAVFGSILPDLIDKPLGHILLGSSVDYGRIYAHSGLFMLSVLIVGIAYRHRKGSWILLALALGIISHLILDSMWELPVTLFYPFQGDFGLHHFPNYFEDSVLKELSSVYEWMFGISVLATLLYLYREKLGKYQEMVQKNIPLVSRIFSLLLIVTGIASMLFAVSSQYNPLSGEPEVEANLIVGLVASVGGSLAFWIWKDGDPGTDHEDDAGSASR